MPHALEADADCLRSLCNGNSNWNRTGSWTFYLLQGAGRERRKKKPECRFPTGLGCYKYVQGRSDSTGGWELYGCLASSAWASSLPRLWQNWVLEGWLCTGGVWGPYFHCAPLVSRRDGGLCRFNSGGGCSRGGCGLRCGLGSGWLGGWSGTSRTTFCFALQKHQRAEKEAVKYTRWLPQFNRWRNRGSERESHREIRVIKNYLVVYRRNPLGQGWSYDKAKAAGQEVHRASEETGTRILKPLEMENFFSSSSFS